MSECALYDIIEKRVVSECALYDILKLEFLYV